MTAPIALTLLDFETSDDGEGHLTLDVMASVRPDHLPTLHAEVVSVLAWLHRHAPDGPGPLDEGSSWDADLRASTERSTRERLRYEPSTRRLIAEAVNGGETVRHTVTLSIAATEAVGQALAEAFSWGGEG
ncbi:hypothetical protein [Sphaerotilus mobilis]|uniref:Uncharacterized protein n=1 Tax=Sphaerotilus mobilis TaxID=47994 RepID=A0A4Q7LJG3_9BURK|nr:hypothetical protein [Sphaerotilus mobilis]RZS54735.1 hypothetical protein EV685_2218 [Sphaerotilus mobilis]